MIILLYLATNVLHIYAVSVFYNTVLGKLNLIKIPVISAYVAYFIINSVSYLLFNNIYLNLATNIIPLLLIPFLYKSSNIRTKFFSGISICAVGMFIDWLAFSVFPTSFLVINNAVQSILFMIFVFIIRNYYYKKIEPMANSKIVWLLMLISLGTIAIGQLTISEFDIRSFFIAMILLVINFLNFYLYDKNLESMRVQQMLRLIETSNQAYQNQLDIMNKSQKKVRLIKHDIVNHIYKIKNCILNEEYTSALSYIDTMEEYISIEKEFVSTGNADINCLLNYKLALANEMGVDFSCDVTLPDDLIVSAFDLTVILGNLLDNSLNALKYVKNKTLLIDITYSKGIIKINIENTFSPSIKNHKKDKETEHGLGLISIQQALDKYNGILKTSFNDDRYYTAVALYNS